MAKRCSARSCYNSQRTNKKIEYFGYPKNISLASTWAIKADRTDLLEKPINALTKYYLCAEHFTSDSFADPPNNRRLKRSFHPTYSVPIPTIFRDNLKKNIPITLPTKLPAEKSNTVQETDILAEKNFMQYQQTNLKKFYENLSQCTEEPTDVQTTDALVDIDTDSGTVASPDHPISPDELHNFNTDVSEQIFTLEPITDTGHLSVSLNLDNISVIDTETISGISDSDERITETLIEIIYPPDDVQPIDSIIRGFESHVERINETCRLCGERFEDSETILLNVFQLKPKMTEYIQSIIPTIRQNDGLPQNICLECLRKIDKIICITNSFKAVQERITEQFRNVIVNLDIENS